VSRRRLLAGAVVALTLVLSLLPSLRLLADHRALGRPDSGDRVTEPTDES
jgi:hypothetical protein